MNRRDFMKVCGGSAAAILSNSIIPERIIAAEKKRPNIVLVMTDDQGTDSLGCYGNPVIKTANMDALAAEGVRFTHAFCTHSTCSASRAVTLTGLHSHANGMYGLSHAYHHFSCFDNVKSLPVMLSKSGYRTGNVGKLHVNPKKVFKFDVTIASGVKNSRHRNTVQMAVNCRDFIEADDQPFFLYYCTSDPHPSPPWVKSHLPYAAETFGNRPEGYDGVTPVEYDPNDVIVPPFIPDRPKDRVQMAQYYQSVSRIDQGLGRLIEIVKKAGKYDNTVFIFISDNGIAWPGAKCTLYEAGMRLPCIVRTPWQKNKGIACDAMITWADITPTILDFAGVDQPGVKFHGRSFGTVLEQEKTKGFDEIYASSTFHTLEMFYPMRVVRQRKYKLIWNIAYKLNRPFGGNPYWQAAIKRGDKYYGLRTVEKYLQPGEFELYDLENDPQELNNLADDPEYAKVLENLKQKIKKFQQETKDPFITRYSYE
jgi:N-sulfoglucosamine sulfohydrolase